MRVLKRVALGWLALVVGGFVAALVVRKNVPEHGTEEDDFVSIVAAAGGREFSSRSEDLQHIDVLAVMGGAMVDLRNAHIADQATMDIRIYAGGVDVVVPDGWRVEVVSKAFMGGIANRSDPDADNTAPLLLVAATIVMGGCEIHQVEGD